MSNFGTRLAYPIERTAAPATPRRAGGLVARILASLAKALDEAPFDLAWPPSPRSYARRPLER